MKVSKYLSSLKKMFRNHKNRRISRSTPAPPGGWINVKRIKVKKSKLKKFAGL